MTPSPYAKYLEGKPAMRALEDTPAAIEVMTRQWPRERYEMAHAPGKWTARQVLVHLAQTEMVLATRLRFTLADADYVIQPFDQDDWMRAEPDGPAVDALQAYLALRRMTLSLCRTLSSEQRSRTATHVEFGRIDVEWLLAWLAGHELNHLPQLAEVDRTGGA